VPLLIGDPKLISTVVSAIWRKRRLISSGVKPAFSAASTKWATMRASATIWAPSISSTSLGISLARPALRARRLATILPESSAEASSALRVFHASSAEMIMTALASSPVTSSTSLVR
jgi:hypothetical protein